jgi:hypothetical protein
MVRRAVRGLPVPPGRSPSREIATDGFVCGLLTACRVVAYRDVSLVDPFTGQLREIVRGRGSSDLAGVLCAVQGSTACVLLERPDGPRVEAYDAKDGQLLARWRFPAGSIPNSISVVPPGALLVADSDAVHRISLSDPLPPVRWEIDEGVDRLLHADGELAVVRTMDGSAVCMDSRSGERLFSAQPGEGASTAWAARVGEAVYVLEATGLEGIVRHGPESHFLGTGFRFRALRLPGGAPLWSRELPGTGFQVAGPPLRVGRLWLLRSSEPGRLHVLAADAETGEQAFNLTLEGPESPEPFSLAAAAGGLVIGRQQEVLALAPSEEAVREQSGNAEVSAGAAPRPE